MLEMDTYGSEGEPIGIARRLYPATPHVRIRAGSGPKGSSLPSSQWFILMLKEGECRYALLGMESTWVGLATALIGSGVIGIIGSVVLVKMGFGRQAYNSVSKASRAAIKSVTKRFRRK
jgi:hypothetical protein